MQITTKSGLTLQLPSLEEDAQISAALDEESPELDESFFQKAVPAKDILGSDMVSWLNGKAPTPVNTSPTGTHGPFMESVQLSSDVIDGFRAAGPDWRNRIELILREWLATH